MKHDSQSQVEIIPETELEPVYPCSRLPGGLVALSIAMIPLC